VLPPGVERACQMFTAEQYRAKAAEFTPEVLLALCLRDRFANVGFQVSARCLV